MTYSAQPQSPSVSSSLLVNQEEESFNYRQIKSVVRRRAWLILVVSIAVIGGIWTRTLSQPPRYRSSFQLLVEPIAGDEEFQQLSEQLGGATLEKSSGLDYATQIQVLTSSQVMRPIYEKVQADYPGLEYEELTEGLRVIRLGETKILTVSYESENPQLAGVVTEVVAEEYVNYSEQQQQTGEARVLRLIDEQTPLLEERVTSLQNEIQQFRNQNNVIDPIEKGNLLSENIAAVEQRQQDTRIALQENISLRENLLQQLGVGLDEAMTTVALSEAPRYQELLNQLKEIETQIALELGRFKADSPNIEALNQQRESILELLQQEATAVLGQGMDGTLTTQVSSPNPIRLSLTQDLIAATNQIRVLMVRQEALKEAGEEVREQLGDITQLAREYEEINQRLIIAQENLKRFIDRREQLKIQAVQTTLPWQVLEAPFEPSQPISGNTRGLILGGIAGILAGAGAAYLAEKIDGKIHSPDDIKDISNLPVLGMIPFSKALQESKKQKGGSHTLPIYSDLEEEASHSPELTNDNGKPEETPTLEQTLSFGFGEAFKTLHTNLSFMNPDRPIKSVVISSCIPGEGKSTTAINLAQAAASIGKRVLIVDSDMRRPQLHQVLEVPNQYGLSDVISSGLNLDEVVQQLPAHPNLYLLTSGSNPPDTNRLLSSEKMKELAKQWETSYDLVIYDTPPLGGLADAKILTPLSSGLIMVAGLGTVDRIMFKDVIETLKLSRTTLLGVVANGIKESSASEYYYYYYYYHNYYYRSQSAQNSRNRVKQ